MKETGKKKTIEELMRRHIPICVPQKIVACHNLMKISFLVNNAEIAVGVFDSIN